MLHSFRFHSLSPLPPPSLSLSLSLLSVYRVKLPFLVHFLFLSINSIERLLTGVCLVSFPIITSSLSAALACWPSTSLLCSFVCSWFSHSLPFSHSLTFSLPASLSLFFSHLPIRRHTHTHTHPIDPQARLWYRHSSLSTKSTCPLFSFSFPFFPFLFLSTELTSHGEKREGGEGLCSSLSLSLCLCVSVCVDCNELPHW